MSDEKISTATAPVAAESPQCGRCDTCEQRDEQGNCTGCAAASSEEGASAPCCMSGDSIPCDNPYADRSALELRGCGGAPVRHKLHATNYLDDIPGGMADDEMVEVQFKNTRKGFYLNSGHLPLKIGDMVAVESMPGHDIGRVSMLGALVRLQMRKAGVKPGAETRRVFRLAKENDLERYRAAIAREQDTMIRARRIASSLQLDMKIGDVEYQGDGNKAIFYYIAEERVDFRQLIKVLAETFKVRVEMRQIGARQEAGKIGGIGPCGHSLCCSTWMRTFVSVSTAAARYQDLSLNPQKLAGQCGKLKCCLNFEVDAYMESGRLLPAKDVHLETADATYYYFKADILRKEITYSSDRNIPANLVTLTADEAFAIIDMNRRGEKPLQLKEDTAKQEKERKAAAIDLANQDSLTRFDKKKKNRNRDNSQRRRDDTSRQLKNSAPQPELQETPQEGSPVSSKSENTAIQPSEQKQEKPNGQRSPQQGNNRRDRRPNDRRGSNTDNTRQRDIRQRDRRHANPTRDNRQRDNNHAIGRPDNPAQKVSEEPPMRERRAKTDRFGEGTAETNA